MITDKKQILNVILTNYEKDYEAERFSDDYELISAYKRILEILESLGYITAKDRLDIKWAIDEKQQYFEEFY